MTITKTSIKEHIEQCFEKGYINIIDHRRNNIVLEDGKFSVNGVVQPKVKKSIEVILLEAFRLTRFIKINETAYIRKGNKWLVDNQ